MRKKQDIKKPSYKMYVLFFVALFFVIGIALSYAYLGVNAINTSTKSNLGSSLQCMNISYSESDILDLDYNFPVKDSYALANIIPVNITVTNNCPSGEGIVTYTLAISSLFNEEGYISDNQIRMQATRTKANETKNIIRTPMYFSMLDEMPNGDALVYLKEDIKKRDNMGTYSNINSYIIDSYAVSVGETVNYEVYLWVDYYEGDITRTGLNDNSTEGKDFSAAISILTNDEIRILDLGEAYAITTSDDTNSTLTFLRSITPLVVGEEYNGDIITNVYTGFEENVYESAESVPWHEERESITNVVFEDEIRPISTSHWFDDINIDTIDVSNLNTSLITDTTTMFEGTSINNVIGLNNVYVEDVIVDEEEVFEEELPLELISYAIYTDSDKMLTFVKSDTQIKQGDLYNGKTVTTVYTGFNEEIYSYDTNKAPWTNKKIIEVTFEDEITPVSTATWFADIDSLTTVNLENLNTSKVQNMSSMFRNSGNNLVISNIGNLDISRVVNMSYMFAGANISNLSDITNWNTGYVTNMKKMFKSANIRDSLDLSGWNVSWVLKHEEFSTNTNNITSPIWIN